MKVRKKTYSEMKTIYEGKTEIVANSEYLEGSVSVEEMISALQKLPKGSRLVVTQEGSYLCHGDYADCFLPELDQEGYYRIGHSDQRP